MPIEKFDRVTNLKIWESDDDPTEFGIEFFHPDGTSTRLGFSGAPYLQKLIDSLERLKERNARMRPMKQQ